MQNFQIIRWRTNSINRFHLSLICVSACVLELVVGQQGPVFVLEPPSTLVFSNTTGSQLSCSAHGSPTPHVTWITSPDQRSVTAVPGLRWVIEHTYVSIIAAGYFQDCTSIVTSFVNHVHTINIRIYYIQIIIFNYLINLFSINKEINLEKRFHYMGSIQLRNSYCHSQYLPFF